MTLQHPGDHWVLRGGQTTEDRRLDRLVHYDERSREYPIRALIEEKEPRSYTWNFEPRDLMPLDQGPDGACVGFAFMHELLTKPSPVDPLGDGDYSYEAYNRFAKERLYWEAQKIDHWDGGSYPGAGRHYEGTSVLAGAKVLEKLGYIEEYRWAFGLSDLVLAVGYQGPAVLGIPWFEGMFETDEDGFIHPTGREMGGHAILCPSVDADDEFFRIVNSWGNWGGLPDWTGEWQEDDIDHLTGWCKVSFEDMDYLLHHRGEACIPVVRGAGTREEGE